MTPSFIEMEKSCYLRLSILQRLAQNPKELLEIDGTIFIPGVCGYEFFTAMRSIFLRTQELDLQEVADRIGLPSQCFIGIVDIFYPCCKISKELCDEYVNVLKERLG